MTSPRLLAPEPPAGCDAPAGTVVIVSAEEAKRPWAVPILVGAGIRCDVLADAAPVLALAPAQEPGCVVLDLRLAKTSALEVQWKLSQREDPRAVLFLTSRADVPTVVQAMRRGASDFLLKPVPPGVFIEAVRRALRDSATRSRECTLRAHMLRRYGALTRREKQVVVGVAAGYLNKQIAWRLQTAERTVKAQRARAMEKIGARTTADVVRFAEQLARAGLRPERI